MRYMIGVALLALGMTGVALASKPKPMECDPWSCSERCAPARYAAVRGSWMPHWMLSSPLYGAAVVESSAVLAVFLLGAFIRKRRRRAEESRASEPGTGRLVRRITAAAFLGVLLLSPTLESKPPPPATGKEQVYCAICGDYTFDAKDAQPAMYEGKRIYLCSIKELKMLQTDPDRYVWAIDQVSGKKVHKLRALYTVDRRVQVRKVKEKNRAEVWPRRFFFESAKTRDEFLKNPQKYLKEPYDV